MTKLSRPVSRELSIPGERRPVIITLDPANRISFRVKRCREKYYINTDRVFILAVKGTT